MQDALNLSTGAIAGIDSAFLGLYAIGQLTLLPRRPTGRA